MWGDLANNIFAVGFAGAIVHYDGTEWSVRKTDEGSDLYGIWGASGTEVFAVGDKGTVLEYRGDVDSDEVADLDDNCPEIANTNQTNSDGDSYGDACDNCPGVTNADQANSDYDTRGNLCDNCPTAMNEDQADSDADSLGNACDNCPTASNPEQEDTFPPRGNFCGDACECEGNFDGDLDVDGTDASTFKHDFGRRALKNRCNIDPAMVILTAILMWTEPMHRNLSQTLAEAG